MLRRAFSISLFILAICLLAPHANAQIQLGTLTLQGSDPIPCSQAANSNDFLPGANCFSATITNCPNNVQPINLTFGWAGPASPAGTIVFFSGTGGETPVSGGGDELTYAKHYVTTYEVVQVEWIGSPWEDPSSDGSGGDILDAACRPATFLNFINSTSGYHAAGSPMCAQGNSAGSAQVAYSMAWYGAGSYLKYVELLNGPVLSQIDTGCAYPAGPNENICATTNGVKQYGCTANTTAWTDNPIYVPNANTSIDQWSGTPVPSCSASNASGYLATWRKMGIVDGTNSTTSPTFGYPTGVHAWLCAGYATINGVYQCTAPKCPNNSAAQGNFFYEQFTSSADRTFQLTGIPNCVQEEGVDEGTDPDTGLSAITAIENDMENHCVSN